MNRELAEGFIMKGFFFLFLLSIGALAMASSMTIFAGDPAPVTKQDLARHPMGSELYTETWGVLTAHEDGSFGFVNFGVSNAGIGDGKPTVNLSYWSPEGNVSNGIVLHESRDFSGAEDRLFLKAADSVLEKTDRTISVRARASKVGAELSVTGMAPAFQIRDGRIGFNKGSDFWRWVVISPRARVEGAFTTDGARRPVKGYAYLDHSWSNLAFFSFSKRWMSLRIHGPEHSINFVEFLGAKDYRGTTMRSLMAADDSGVYHWSLDFEMAVRKAGKTESGREYPVHFVLISDKVKVQVGVRKLMEQIDPLAHVGKVEGAVIRKFVANPQLLRFLASYKVDVDGPKGPSYFTGKAVFEMLYL